MKNYIKAGSLAVLCLLCACAQTAQGKLRQAVYDTASAYHLLASPMLDIMAGHVPGVSLSAGQKALARKASQSVLDELSALEQSIQAGNTLVETAVAALQADFAAFSTCWSGLTVGSTPAACTMATTASTATTATQADAAVSVSTNGKE
ncbi:MAG: hypothetical protein LKH76_05005 [Acetobacter fabarum]|uniref:hypothetical protein n=1 Tax=Acetobacter fabarum TaxID=483199 RepID=UPI00242E7893|nr:hypothetical protein [Acetobacter fabarum]MCH4025047.1 hypothetical protein [Acetobacter fabarum]MCH4055429.1 hypothetical protein [Acetobacter fabarum]MCH4127893.1 hypothetical protein [Acetobacter fabarum]MCH4141104.1 hypothetical protein [Acetobacter fabarum]MCI1298148.1 hypothetical protein [Acetobacter fabarum]